MWPWGHAAVGYLLYAVFRRGVQPSGQHGLMVVALALGTQFPDLIDKPLAWSVPVLPTGRSLAHSLLTAGLVLGVGWWLLRRTAWRRYLLPFGFGWVVHSLSDAADVLLGGDLAYANYLLWPALTTPPYDTEKSFAAHLTQVDPTPYFLVQLGLTVLAVLVWRRDGYPGLRALGSALSGPGNRPRRRG